MAFRAGYIKGRNYSMKNIGLQIDKSAKIPLYCQLKEIILAEINKMKADEMIAPESFWIENYDVSRTTVRQAFSELINEGYLYTVRGKGTFIAERKVDLAYMNKIESFAEQVKSSGRAPYTKVLMQKIVPATFDVAKYLEVKEGANVLLLYRLRYADSTPVAITESYMPLPRCNVLIDMDLEQVSLYEVLAQNEETEVRHVRRIIKAGIATEEERTLLELGEEQVLLRFVNIAYTAKEKPVEYCNSCYRVDMNVFTVDLYK